MDQTQMEACSSSCPPLVVGSKYVTLRACAAPVDGSCGYLPLSAGSQVDLLYIGAHGGAQGWLFGCSGGASGWFPRDVIGSVAATSMVEAAPTSADQQVERSFRSSWHTNVRSGSEQQQWQKWQGQQWWSWETGQPWQRSSTSAGARFRRWAASSDTRVALERTGLAIFRDAFRAVELSELQTELPDLLEGGRIRMSDQKKGDGVYDYLRRLPTRLADFRTLAYEALLPLAAQFLETHAYEVVRLANKEFDLSLFARGGQELPPTLAEFEELCRQKVQSRPSCLLLRYGEGGENKPHRDVYGPVSFPLQMLVLLHEPEYDFSGGQFFTHVNGREYLADAYRGDLIVFRTSCKHGCKRVLPGRQSVVQRHVIGLQFALRQLRRERLARRQP